MALDLDSTTAEPLSVPPLPVGKRDALPGCRRSSRETGGSAARLNLSSKLARAVRYGTNRLGCGKFFVSLKFCVLNPKFEGALGSAWRKWMMKNSVDKSGDHGANGNRLLDSLPADVTRRLLRGAELVPLPLKTILFEPNQEIMSVHFPTGGVISLVTPHSDGSIVQVATIGNEGIVGVPLVLGDGFAAVRAISQVAGEAIRVDARAFVKEVKRGGEMATLVQRDTSALFSQISVAAGCNRLHPHAERPSPRPPMCSDPVGRGHFPITQEFLAQMPGSRRATVTISARAP